MSIPGKPRIYTEYVNNNIAKNYVFKLKFNILIFALYKFISI